MLSVRRLVAKRRPTPLTSRPHPSPPPTREAVIICNYMCIQAVVGQREMAAATGRAYSTAAVRAAVRAGLERAEAEQAAEDAWVVAEEC